MMNTIIGSFEKLETASLLIKAGEIVAFPTETVYGLGADAFNPIACLKVFKVKGRPSDNPFIVHLDNIDDIYRVAKNPSKTVINLFEKFTPGPLTIVLQKKDEVPSIVTAGLNTVGVRIPNHPLALAFIRQSETPIAAPSANISGAVSPTTAMHVFEYLSGKIKLILDGGPSSTGIESTILDMTKDIPVILRPGSISRAELLTVLSDVKNGYDVSNDRPLAPGMKYRHYAPSVPCVCTTSPITAQAIYESNLSSNPVIIGASDFITQCVKTLNMLNLGNTIKEHSARLYAYMKTAEKKYGYIIIEYFNNDDSGIYSGLNNRILKACGGNIVL
ncbi:MAG: threonylcarbamoyl-AMP synthase [Christensenellaceae bacterium]|jgi:L-threonylcarbamoyladenylate synthase|nr:threonylcarbamoyl-AMP synthase [Christensenellaceae bacterium]